MSDPRPSMEYMLTAAWDVGSPASASIRRAEREAGKFLFPTGFWPDVARRVLDWERRQLTEAEIEGEVAAAIKHYQKHWSHVEETAPKRTPSPLQARTKADLTTMMMDQLLGNSGKEQGQ